MAVIAFFVFLVFIAFLLLPAFLVSAQQRFQCFDCGWLLEESAVDVEASERGQVEASEQLEALAADEATGCVERVVPRLSSSRSERKLPSARKRR